MRIAEPRIVRDSRSGRLEATVTTRDKQHQAYFALPPEQSHMLAARSDAFLPALAVAAPSIGEHHIEVEGASPQLVDGVRTVVQLLRSWYPEHYPQPVTIDSHAEVLASPVAHPRTASLLSGGLDSLALLRRNQLMFSTGDPGRVTAGVYVNFQDGARGGIVSQERAFYEGVLARLKDADLGVEIVPVRSNLLGVFDYIRSPRWAPAWHGAWLASAAHALSGAFTAVRIASSYRLEELKPWGSHPLLDNELSSTALRFVHSDLTIGRSKKAELVATWDEAIAAATVCVGPFDERLARWNCGHCEKCLRTAASFVACGQPGAAHQLIGRRFTVDDLKQVRITSDVVESFWSDIELASRQNDEALSAAAGALVRAYRLRKLAHRLAEPLGIRRLRAWHRGRRQHRV